MKKCLTLFSAVLIFFSFNQRIFGQTFDLSLIDQTPDAPLSNPVPASFQPRYISGFGQGDSFTVFFEDRDNGNRISFNSTTTGPTGFAPNNTPTDISETHFCVKDWPITIGSMTYQYRAWGSMGNNPNLRFYVSNNLVHWVMINTFQIPNAPAFTNARGAVFYGFHDVIKINGKYYAFAESNLGQTMVCRSNNGDDVWEAFESVGGTSLSDGNLITPVISGLGWTPSGSFVDLGYDRGYGLLYISPDNQNLYLAINTAAKKISLSAADFETAFLDPAYWTWNNDTVGPANNPLLSATAEHDIRECWLVPQSNPDDEWMIIYDADFGINDGGKALGYTTANQQVVSQAVPLSNSSVLITIVLILLASLYMVFTKSSRISLLNMFRKLF
jgi:hypothetical protein